MSKGTKIFLFVLVGILLLCVCGCAAAFVFVTYGGGQFLESAVMDDPQAARDLGDAMFEYTVPPGYSEEMGMNMGIVKMVMITPGTSGGQIIMLMQLPDMMASDPDMYQEQMRQQMQQQFGGQSNMELVETETMTIRGQQVELMYFEGQSVDLGVLTRMMVSSFIEGDKGQVMVMIMGAAANWDQMMVDDFMKSIR